MAKRKHVHHKKYKTFQKRGFVPVAPLTASMYRGSSGGIRGVGFDRPTPAAVVAPPSHPQRNLIPNAEPPPPDPVMTVPAVAKAGLTKTIGCGPQVKDMALATA